MKTTQAYLDHITGQAAAAAYVTFDKVSTLTNSEGTTDSVTLNVEPSASGNLTTAASANASTVLMMVPAVANSTPSNAVSATKGKRAFAVLINGNTQFTINSVSVPATAYAMTGNGAVDALNIASTANKDLASAAGLTMDAVHAYGSQVNFVLNSYAGNYAAASLDERYTTASVSAASTTTGSIFTVGIEDEFKLTIGSNSVTTTPGSVSGNATDLAGLEAMLIAAWGAKYGKTGTASLSALATIVNGGLGAGSFVIQSLQKDSGGKGLEVKFSVTDKTQATGQITRTSGNIGYKVGPTTASTDNSTAATATGGGVIVTFESKLEGVTDAILTGMTTVVGTGTTSMTELVTTYAASTGVTTYALAQANRTDVRNVVAAVADTSTSTAQDAIAFDRTAWLG
jgi:hypothetical protein